MNDYLSILKRFTIIENKRISLRKFKVTDAKDFFHICSDSQITEFLTWEPHRNINETIKTLNERFINNPMFFAIELKSEDRCIGCIDLRLDKENKKASFGYMVNREYWNNGFMTESLESILDLIFNKLKLNRVESTHYVGNEGSGRVMEKCGMKYEGTSPQELIIKGKFVDVVHYGLLYNDYVIKQEVGI